MLDAHDKQLIGLNIADHFFTPGAKVPGVLLWLNRGRETLFEKPTETLFSECFKI